MTQTVPENCAILETIWISETGPIRDRNEDSVTVVCDPRPGIREKETILVVADGMGGLEAGEVASAMVTKNLPELFFSSSLEDRAEALLQAVTEVNRIVYDARNSVNVKQGTGSTVVAAAVVNECLITVNVGDSRCYLFKNNSLRQLSKDHCMASNLFPMFKSDTRPSFAHVLTQAIGPQPRVTPHLNITKLVSGDIILLCSDGLSSVVPEEEICSILSHSPVSDTARELLQAVVDHHGDDNVSIIISRVAEISA